MNDPETPDGNNWISKICEGGIPQLLVGPAGKAISRLIGAGVDIPAAYLEGITQGIHDKTDARRQITLAISKQVAKTALNDPAIMERATANMIGRSYRAQQNKDAVVAVALENLTNDLPPPESQGPSDDWLTKFERHAEDASSDDLRMMFGRILAGEIKSPGAISPTTLHFVSMLDSDTAELIERVLPSCVSRGIAILECLKPALTVVEITTIEQSGFWTPDKIQTLAFDTNGISIFSLGDDHGVAIRGTPNSKIKFSISILSRSGNDLVKVVRKPFNIQEFANIILNKDEASNVYYGRIVSADGKVSLDSPKELTLSDQQTP